MGVNMFDHELGETLHVENYDNRYPGRVLASATGAVLLPDAVG
jgi:hypothetical protein